MDNNKEIKNFQDFLNENWDNIENFIPEQGNEDDFEKELLKLDAVSDSIEDSDRDIKDIKSELSKEEDKEEDTKHPEGCDCSTCKHPEGCDCPTCLKSITPDSIGLPLSSMPTSCGCKVVILNGVVTTAKSNSVACNAASILNEKLVDSKEIKLFQLNIQPVNEGDEPMDGMTQVYESLQGADVIVLVSDVKKGQISSVLQTAMERIANFYKGKELRNVIFSSVITGEEDHHQSVKSSLLNFANNMGMIIGGDCNVFCCVEEDGESCQHNIEADTSTAAACIKELCCATKELRSKMDVTPLPVQPTGLLPLMSDTIADTNTEEPNIEDNIKSFDDFSISDEEHANEVDEVLNDELPTTTEEEERYDYANDIVYNPLENPMSKLDKSIANELPENEESMTIEDETNESELFNFETFLFEKADDFTFLDEKSDKQIEKMLDLAHKQLAKIGKEHGHKKSDVKKYSVHIKRSYDQLLKRIDAFEKELFSRRDKK